MLRLNDIKLEPHLAADKKQEKKLLKEKAAKLLRVGVDSIKAIRIAKKSIDARKKHNVLCVYALDVWVTDKKGYLKDKNAYRLEPTLPFSIAKHKPFSLRPVVVGSGPAGLFCAYALALSGVCPIVLERGKDVLNRQNDVNAFWKTGVLCPQSNVQFGEGGAGTFSDGKLNTNTHDKRTNHVFDILLSHSAPDEIGYQAKPHIGTDQLVTVLQNMRKTITDNGGTFLFEHQWVGFTNPKGQMQSVLVKNPLGETIEIQTNHVVLAVGHSARDTFVSLHKALVPMKPKSFAIGLRIEHKQAMINENQYGRFAQWLPPADYKLAHKLENGRGVYTFCMCPGGQVVNASSEPNHLAVNGMSNFQRNAENGNAAILVTVNPEDFGSDAVLAGVEFQRKWEEKAFRLGGGNYHAPVQLVKDFLQNTPSIELGSVIPSVLPGYTLCHLGETLPLFVTEGISEGLHIFDQKIKGFASDDAVLTGVETRSSSPITMLRNENHESPTRGLFPCGEGAGFAGGIVSAAVDGLKTAEILLAMQA